MRYGKILALLKKTGGAVLVACREGVEFFVHLKYGGFAAFAVDGGDTFVSGTAAVPTLDQALLLVEEAIPRLSDGGCLCCLWGGTHRPDVEDSQFRWSWGPIQLLSTDLWLGSGWWEEDVLGGDPENPNPWNVETERGAKIFHGQEEVGWITLTYTGSVVSEDKWEYWVEPQYAHLVKNTR